MRLLVKMGLLVKMRLLVKMGLLVKMRLLVSKVAVYITTKVMPHTNMIQ